jgi:hypothetical protein
VPPHAAAEIRNPNVETRNNIEGSKARKTTPPGSRPSGFLPISAFEFVSDFEIRISDLSPRFLSRQVLTTLVAVFP